MRPSLSKTRGGEVATFRWPLIGACSFEYCALYLDQTATWLNMGIKENWWRLNYHAVRLVAIPVVKRAMRIKIRAEGELPITRPLLLAPVHRTSVDTYAITNVVDEFISYVSTDRFGHSGIVNYFQKQGTRAIGSVIWQSGGITNTRQRAVALAHDVEDRLDRRLIVAAFTQGEYQTMSVESIEDGLVGLLRRYEVRNQQDKRHDIRIPVVPVGIYYDRKGQGFGLSKTIKWLTEHVPFFPRWVVPSFGTEIVVRFGELQYFEDRSAREVTDIVMREAARLSGIPYHAQPH